MDRNIGLLCVIASRLYRKQFAELARGVGGTGAQWAALGELLAEPGITQGALASRLDVEPITACRLVDRMEHAGLVERRRDPSDRRVWLLFATELATPVMRRMEQVSRELVEHSLTGFSEDEVVTLRSLLERMNCNLAEPAKTAVARPA